MSYSPIQEAFNAGELSERLRGRFGSELYGKGLDFCENFKPTPQGSLLMRTGTKHEVRWPRLTPPRLFPFRVAGESDDHTIAIDGTDVRIYDPTGAEVTRFVNLVTNSGFDTNFEPWAELVGWPIAYPGGPAASAAWAGGVPEWTDGKFRTFAYRAAKYDLALTPGRSYRITAKAWYTNDAGGPGVGDKVYAVLGIVDPSNASQHFEIDQSARTISFDFVAGAGTTALVLASANAVAVGTWVPRPTFDDVVLYDIDAPVVGPLAASVWTEDQLDAMQFSPAPHADLGVIFHPKVQPQVIKKTAPDVWEMYAAEFVSAPLAWGEGNWPGAAELGFQGRLFAGSTPNEPGLVWGSKVGSLFDFTLGVNPNDAVSFTISTKGRIIWLQGQKSLLAGGEQAEHSISGSNLMVSEGDVNIRDESAFGSAPVQAVPIGDQVVFVAKDRRTVRALAFSLQDNGWISKAVSFIAEHLTVGGIREIHFAHSPDPMIICVLNLGGAVACVYDRSEQVIAWWRLALGATVRSAAVCHGDDGASVMLSLTRDALVNLERLKLHEVNAEYLDDHTVTNVGAAGFVHGLTQYAGKTVTAVVNGAVFGAVEVDGGGTVLIDAELTGAPVTFGAPFVATARTLPRNLKSGKAHTPRVGLILNRSALPRLNGYRSADRTPSTDLNTVEALRTGKCSVSNLGWSEDDKITITQDLPFRTEILALFSITEAQGR